MNDDTPIEDFLNGLNFGKSEQQFTEEFITRLGPALVFILNNSQAVSDSSDIEQGIAIAHAYHIAVAQAQKLSGDAITDMVGAASIGFLLGILYEQQGGK